MDINTNVSAMQAAANLSKTQNAIAASTAKLSSGFRINSAADDAAGLGIANKLDSDVGAYQQASRNASQANSIYNIAEGAATSIQGMLNQMKQLAAEAASDTVDTNGRVSINRSSRSSSQEIDRTVNTTKFEGTTSARRCVRCDLHLVDRAERAQPACTTSRSWRRVAVGYTAGVGRRASRP